MVAGGRSPLCYNSKRHVEKALVRLSLWVRVRDQVISEGSAASIPLRLESY
jgi:hypothetical protein